MRINSAAYRALTLSSAAGFAFAATQSYTPSMTEAHSTPLPYQVARLFSGALVPAFLLWRNLQTLRLRQTLIPPELSVSSPWYYKLTVLAVWLALAFQFVLPALAVLAGYSSFGGSVAAALLLGNASVVGLWFQAPTVFFMELQCAYYGRKPNKPIHATCEDARS